jgi:hypothetical protein
VTSGLLRLAITLTAVACAKAELPREDPRGERSMDEAAAVLTPGSEMARGAAGLQATAQHDASASSGAPGAGSSPDAGSPPDAGSSALGPARPRRTPIDPKKIVGHVSGRRGVFAREGSGRIDRLAVAPIDLPGGDKDLVTLTFSIVDRSGAAHTFSFTVPRKLPLPLATGDEVAFTASTAGGGPNQRDHVVITARDGSLLFAVGDEPPGWTVERGARVGKAQRGGGYVTYDHEVSFQRGQTTKVVKPGAWAVFDDFYVWGAAVSRVIVGREHPPADHVGSWLDFAIIAQ